MKLRGWLAIGFGAYVAYVVASQINWGYYKEDGAEMAESLARPIRTGDAEEAAALAGEVCADPTMTFDRRDRSAAWVEMPEQATVRHFFITSRFSNIIWLGVGWKGRFCLARYELVMKDHGWMSPFPRRLFPFPLLEWNYQIRVEERRLVERIPNRPAAPEGVRSLFPGECATGQIRKGETLRFQMVMPSFGQKVELYCEWDHPSGRCEDVEWKRDGHAIAGESDELGGGTYVVTLRAPLTEPKHYRMRMFWGSLPGCDLPQGWTFGEGDALPDER